MVNTIVAEVTAPYAESDEYFARLGLANLAVQADHRMVAFAGTCTGFAYLLSR